MGNRECPGPRGIEAVETAAGWFVCGAGEALRRRTVYWGSLQGAEQAADPGGRASIKHASAARVATL